METNTPANTPAGAPANAPAGGQMPAATAVPIAPELAVIHPKLDKEGNVDLAVISPDDAQKYSAINQSLSPADANSIINFGSEAQNSMEKYSNDFLTSVRTF